MNLILLELQFLGWTIACCWPSSQVFADLLVLSVDWCETTACRVLRFQSNFCTFFISPMFTILFWRSRKKFPCFFLLFSRLEQARNCGKNHKKFLRTPKFDAIVRLLLEYSCVILISFNIVVIFNITSALVKNYTSWIFRLFLMRMSKNGTTEVRRNQGAGVQRIMRNRCNYVKTPKPWLL